MAWQRVWGIAFVSVLLTTGATRADDVEGASDHPLLSRFPTATIRAYDVRDYDAAVLPAGRIDDSGAAEDLLVLEGKITRIGYRIAGDRSVLEVMRNYENALAGAGFEVLFACSSHEDCGIDMMAFISDSGRVRPTGFGDAFFGGTAEQALLARRSGPNGEVHVFLHAVEDTSTERTILYQQVVEAAALRTDQVSVMSSDELFNSLDRQGYVVVPGVYFDTGRSDIKPASEAALAEMAGLLQANPALKVYIVGHTDNEGDLSANMALSEARAAAVAHWLVTTYRIDGARLAAHGVASLAPVASNADEDGRARNRRVEVVVQ